MPATAPNITLITQGYGVITLEYDVSLLAPTNIVAAWQPNYTSVLVSWVDTNLTEARYGLFRSENGAEFYFLVDVPMDTTAFLDTIDLNNGRSYQYKIIAFSDTGYGPAGYSNILEPRNINVFNPVGNFFHFNYWLTPEPRIFPWDHNFRWGVAPDSTEVSLTDFNFSYILSQDLPTRPEDNNFKFHVLAEHQANDPEWVKYPRSGVQ